MVYHNRCSYHTLESARPGWTPGLWLCSGPGPRLMEQMSPTMCSSHGGRRKFRCGTPSHSPWPKQVSPARPDVKVTDVPFSWGWSRGGLGADESQPCPSHATHTNLGLSYLKLCSDQLSIFKYIFGNAVDP